MGDGGGGLADGAGEAGGDVGGASMRRRARGRREREGLSARAAKQKEKKDWLQRSIVFVIFVGKFRLCVCVLIR